MTAEMQVEGLSRPSWMKPLREASSSAISSQNGGSQGGAPKVPRVGADSSATAAPRGDGNDAQSPVRKKNPATRGKRGSGRRRNGKSTPKTIEVENQALRDMLVTMGKVTLQSAQRSRLALGCLVTTILLPADSPVAKAMEGEKTSYLERAGELNDQMATAKKAGAEADQTRLKGEITSNGPPDPYILVAMCLALAPLEIGLRSRQELQKAIESFQQGPLKVLMCRLEKTAEESTKKISLALEDRQFRDSLAEAAANATFQVKTGPAPPGFLEDELSSYIEALAAQKK